MSATNPYVIHTWAHTTRLIALTAYSLNTSRPPGQFQTQHDTLIWGLFFLGGGGDSDEEEGGEGEDPHLNLWLTERRNGGGDVVVLELLITEHEEVVTDGLGARAYIEVWKRVGRSEEERGRGWSGVKACSW